MTEIITENDSFLVITTVDFTVRSTNWYIDDKTNYEEKKIDAGTTQHDLKQKSDEPTHWLKDLFSCINL